MKPASSSGDEGNKLKLGTSVYDAWIQVQKWRKKADVKACIFLHTQHISLGTEV